MSFVSIHFSLEKVCERFSFVWFQKISMPPPWRELEIPGGWGDQSHRKFRRGGGGLRRNSRPDGRKSINSLHTLEGAAYQLSWDVLQF